MKTPEEVSRVTTRSNRGLWARCSFAAMVLAAVMGLSSCSDGGTDYTDFTPTADDGWLRNTPIYFTPEYSDSTRVYDLYVAVRHDSEYDFSTLNLVVDIMTPTGQTERRKLSIGFADEAGNWTGSGFGAMYQHKALLKRGVSVADLQKLALWHAMPSDTLTGITEIGIVLK